MRKLFRMKYEPCNGDCYAECAVVDLHSMKLSKNETADFFRRLLAVHLPACGNSNLMFRVDMSDEYNMFVATFEHYGQTDMFMSDSCKGAMNKLIDAVLVYYNSPAYSVDTAKDPGLGHDVCHYGEDSKLIDFALKFSGLTEAEQNELRVELAAA